MKCHRSGCGHLDKVHVEGRCRVTGCDCEGFIGYEPTLTGRRVCIDLPDGYTLSVSLIPPWTPDEAKES